MGGEKSAYEPYGSLPIPTYEEAISRPSSSQSFLGPSEISNDAERQGLLGRTAPQHNGYQAPTVESARSSLDFQISSGERSSADSVEGLQMELEQMEVLDPVVTGYPEGSRGHRLSKRITSLKQSLSSIHLPFRRWIPSLETLRARIPSVTHGFKVNWILVGRVFALLLVVTLVWLLFVSDLFSIGQRQGAGQMFDPESVRNYIQTHINETNILELAERFTGFDHIAGTKGNFVLAQWVEDIFNSAHLENIGLERFDVYLNYYKEGGRRVAIIDPPEKAWTAALEEELAYSDPPRVQTDAFHGLSRSGNVTGPLIYANYGSREDFRKLANNGIDVKGSVVLVRYYGTQSDRALKIKAAEQAGAVGCIIYSDPAEDGSTKGKEFPKGRYMPNDGVQRGTVALTSWVAGDVLSSGFASLPGERRRDSKEDASGLNKIPSLPLAARDAQKLLEALEGHGKKLDGWAGGLQVGYSTGDQNSPIAQLMNEQDEVERQPIYNVLGRITGVEQSEKTVIVGNHRDAWCFGAADPGSGTAVFLEIVRVFGELRELGWRPLRTIEFASWDAEEYNLIGSTEHVEARMDDLRKNGIAYLNVDIAAVGDDFQASGCPSFEKVLLSVLDRVNDPVKNTNLRSTWEAKNRTLGGLGAGSDHVAFQDMAGTSSIDMTFAGPRFPYHSCYDNFEWMSTFGDPGFRYHKTLAQVWALLILEMADSPMIPFDHEAYARYVKRYIADLEQYANLKGAGLDMPDFKPLHDAVDLFELNAREFHHWDQAWQDIVYSQGGFESNVMAIKRVGHNARMTDFETNLLDIDGGVSTFLSELAGSSELTRMSLQLPGREQYKHVIFAPALWSGYDEAFFPGIRDAIDDGEWQLAREQLQKAADILIFASKKLLH